MPEPIELKVRIGEKVEGRTTRWIIVCSRCGHIPLLGRSSKELANEAGIQHRDEHLSRDPS